MLTSLEIHNHPSEPHGGPKRVGPRQRPPTNMGLLKRNWKINFRLTGRVTEQVEYQLKILIWDELRVSHGMEE